MACYGFKTLKISGISTAETYCFRYRLRDDALKASLRRSGILVPVIVTHADCPVVIAGYKRLYAAQTLKLKEVPALIAKKMKPRDAFLLNVVSNWKQGYSDMDRARALGMAVRDFHFKEDEILSAVMPLLGLPGDKTVLEFYRKADQFPPSFKDLVEDGRFPLRGVLPFLKFSKDDQDYFAKQIGSQIKLTSSQLLQAGEWLLDLMKGTGKDLRRLCKERKVLAKMNLSGMDMRTKADLFFSRVKRLRFPGYSLYLEEFEKRRSEVLRDAKELRLEPVQGFEEPGFELHTRVKTSADLDRLLQTLSFKRSSLNSLFEIAL